MPKQYEELFQVCASSTEAIVAIIQRYKTQYTLGNAPFIFVHGAIVAANSVLITSRHTGNPPPLVKDTYLPVLDTMLQEMSVSWALAGKIRTKFRDVLRIRQHMQPGGNGMRPNEVAQPMAEPAVVTPEFHALGGAAQAIDFESPEQYVWDPMSVMDGESEYWAAMGDDILAGLDMNFLDGATGLHNDGTGLNTASSE